MTGYHRHYRANAPYIVLFGTVLDTMVVNAIMIGRSFTLNPPQWAGVGAISCVVTNNMLRRRVAELLSQYKAECEA